MAEPVVNVEKIMEEIRREIQMEEALRDLPRFEDIPLDGGERPAPAEAPAPAAGNVDWPLLAQSLDYLNRNYDIPYYWTFYGSKVKTFLKRLVRRLVKCILAPIVSMQDAVNTHVVRVCNNLKEAVVALMARADAHQGELARLRGELDELRRALERQQTLLSQQDELLTQQSETLAHQDELLARQEEKLAQQDKTLARQDELLAQQDEALAQQKQTLEEQRAALTAQEAALTGAAGSVDALSGLVRETQDMLQVNDRRAADLERDMDCIRRVDGSIFLAGGTIDYNKYSQAGEDSIIAFIVGALGYREDEVTYLDLGANHAKYLSNTYFFYQRGASGVLVEANPELIPELKLLRTRDMILNKCVSSADGETVDFYVMSNDGLSTMSSSSVAHSQKVNDELTLRDVKQIGTVTVKSILKDYFAQPPMLLNVDIEGGEMDVLQALDYDRFRPLIIVVETIPYENGLTIGEKNEEVVSFLTQRGYVEYAFTGINSIFVDRAQAQRINRNLPKVYDGPMDCQRFMLTNEKTKRLPQGICLERGGIAYGPYMTCPAGEYELEVRVQGLGSAARASLDVTGDSGKKNFARLDLKDGVNQLRFSLSEEEKDVEFVVRNQSDAGILLQSVKLN